VLTGIGLTWLAISQSQRNEPNRSGAEKIKHGVRHLERFQRRSTENYRKDPNRPAYAGAGAMEVDVIEQGEVGGAGEESSAVEKVKGAAAGARDRANKLADSASEGLGRVGESASDLGERMKAKANDLADRADEKAGELGERVKAKANDLAERAGEKAGELGERASHLGGRVSEKASRVGEEISRAGRTVSEKVGRVTGAVTESSTAAYRSTKEAAHWATDRVGHGARSAGHFIEENPIAAGAIALGLGALIAMMFPPTRRERQLIGEKADEVKAQVRDAVVEKVERVKDLAGAAAGAAMQAAREKAAGAAEGSPQAEAGAEGEPAGGSAQESRASLADVAGSVRTPGRSGAADTQGLGTPASRIRAVNDSPLVTDPDAAVDVQTLGLGQTAQSEKV
jgi:hypothetical protein